MEMYPYTSPTGAGMAPHKHLAERMEALRADYIEACRQKDEDMKIRIRDDERRIASLIEATGLERPAEPAEPRCIRVTVYESYKVDKRGSGVKQTTIINRYHLQLDVAEVESIMVPVVGPGNFTIRMRSGREYDINEDDADRIEKIMEARR